MNPALLAPSRYIVAYLWAFLLFPLKVKCQLERPSGGLQPCTLDRVLCSETFNQQNLLHHINLPPVTNLVKMNAVDLFYFRFITRQRLFCSQPDSGGIHYSLHPYWVWRVDISKITRRKQVTILRLMSCNWFKCKMKEDQIFEWPQTRW